VSVSFEKFLENKAQSPSEIWLDVPYNDVNGEADNLSHIRVKDLGEWAWEYFSDSIPFRKYFPFEAKGRQTAVARAQDAVPYKRQFLNIAVACLGEEEVKRRMRKESDGK
jgi:hypothetical protein